MTRQFSMVDLFNYYEETHVVEAVEAIVNKQLGLTAKEVYEVSYTQTLSERLLGEPGDNSCLGLSRALSQTSGSEHASFKLTALQHPLHQSATSNARKSSPSPVYPARNT